MKRKVFPFLLAFAAVLMLGSAASAQQKFTVNLNTIQEVPPTGTTGRGRCMVTLNLAQTQITEVTCEYGGLSSNVISGHIHGPAAPGAIAGILFDLTPPTGVTSGSFTRGPFTLTPAQLADLRAKRLYVNIHTSNFTGGEIRGQIKIQTTPNDSEGDGRSDVKVYRPSLFTTYTQYSLNNTIVSSVFGIAGESQGFLYSASDDYDGDGRSDIVFTRVSGSNLVWRILLTGSNTVREQYWGLGQTDFEMPADYDGDGKTDIAVYRITTGFWYILQSSNNQLRVEIWGQPATQTTQDIPMIGDFDGDGKNDVTVIRGVTGVGVVWFTRRSRDNTLQTTIWGGASSPATDFIFPPVQIDVDGDGIQDKMLIRDPNGSATGGGQVTVLVLRSSDNGQLILPFGLDTDAPFAGDYDGDGKTDFVARRNEGGTLVWYIALSTNNWNTAQPRVVRFGQTGDLLTGDSELYDSPERFEIKY